MRSARTRKPKSTGANGFSGSDLGVALCDGLKDVCGVTWHALRSGSLQQVMCQHAVMHWCVADSVASKEMVSLPIHCLFTERAGDCAIARPDIEAKFAFEIDSEKIILIAVLRI